MRIEIDFEQSELKHMLDIIAKLKAGRAAELNSIEIHHLVALAENCIDAFREARPDRAEDAQNRINPR